MLLRWLGRVFRLRRTSSNVRLIADRVWLSSRARLAGLREAVRERSADGATMILLIAHFPDVLAELEPMAAEYAGSAFVRAFLSRQLSPGAARSLPLGESDVVDLIVAERHPLASVDEALIGFAEELPCRSRIVFHLSLDDALLQAFGSESIRATIEQLGATEEEAITHDLVTRSIRRAQRRIERRSTGRSDADSAAEWLERNT